MSEYSYFECRECGFSSVQHKDFSGSTICPLCAGDSGRHVSMSRRSALETDKPEGFDARLGTHEEQAALAARKENP